MTKTICDICGNEMPTEKYPDPIEKVNFCISSHGKKWDICTECRVDLNRWMTIRNHPNSRPEEEIVKPYLNKIRAEIEKMPSELTTDGRRMIRRESVFRIIDNYK